MMEKSWSLLVVFCALAATGFAQNAARDCDAFIHDAHPTDCRKFTNCYDRRFHVFDCIAGLFFNERKQQCDYFGSDLPGCYRNGSVTVTNPCSQNRCPSPQLCHVVNSRRERFECKCRLGYKGFNCNEDINECTAVSNPCKRGTCVNSIGSFSCDCTGTGYHGMRCERQDRTLAFTNACTSRPCGTNGVCQISSQELSGFKCQCNQGFTGTRCQQRLSGGGCSSNPCGSNGQCSPDNFNGYRCTCQNGFQGTNCENDLNECLGSHGCVNGACENNIGSYTCRCSPGWTGNFCTDRTTTLPNACASSPCGTNGVCQISSQELSGYKCECNSGFIGIRCQQRLGGGCSSNPCGSKGQCSPDNFNGFWCTCQNGFHGTYCEKDLNECLGAHGCVNGVCENNIGSYTCRCNTGWTGNFCNTRSSNPCFPNPCGNNGQCDQTVTNLNGFNCRCATGYSGDRCEILTSQPCAPNPCRNSGTCTPNTFNSNGFSCQCTTGYSGDRCETLTSQPCASNPCRNFGTCTPNTFNSNGFSCRCTTGYSGDRCETPTTNQGCQNHQCQAGTCQVNTFAEIGYICDCSGTVFSGIFCNFSGCLNSPCRNGGTCTNTPGGNFLCQCPIGLSGQTCDIRDVSGK